MVVDCSTLQHLTRKPPRDDLIWSTLSFFYANIFCLGLAALICSIKARDRRWAGDLTGDRNHRSKARTLNIIHAALTGVFIITIIILYITQPYIAGTITGLLVRRL